LFASGAHVNLAMVSAWTGRIATSFFLLSACGGNTRDAADRLPADGVSGASGAKFGESGASGDAAAGTFSTGGGRAVGTGSSGGAANAAVSGGANANAGSAGALPKPHASLPCDDQTPRPQGGGYLLCADGSLRRPTAGTCEAKLPRDTADQPLVFEQCTTDTDCTEAAHGFCAYGACKYGCVEDAECESGNACFCGDFIGTCVPATCRSDADCPTDQPCTGYQAVGFDTPDALACQSPLDECVTDAQCHSLNPRVSCKVQVDHRICYQDMVG
jgi:hypothetical protein